MRTNLKKARQAAGMAQKQVAEKLGISERYYKYLEAGRSIGSVDLWDALEDIFSVHQRFLRESHPDQEDSP